MMNMGVANSVVDDVGDGQGGHDDEQGGLLIVTCCS